MSDIVELRPDDGDPFNAGFNACHEAMTNEVERLQAALVKSCREDRAGFLGGCFHANMAEAENGLLRAALTGIAVMDVYTRPGEEPAAEVMRQCAKDALGRTPRDEVERLQAELVAVREAEAP